MLETVVVKSLVTPILRRILRVIDVEISVLQSLLFRTEERHRKSRRVRVGELEEDTQDSPKFRCDRDNHRRTLCDKPKSVSFHFVSLNVVSFLRIPLLLQTLIKGHQTQLRGDTKDPHL